jgi:undecaprenyl-diphosphatase
VRVLLGMKKDLIVDVGAFGGLPFYVLVLFLAWITTHMSLLWDIVIALLIAYTVSSSIRLLYFKERPEKRKYTNWLEKIDASSFPSMHVTRAFALAGIGGNFFNDAIMWILFVLLALLVGYSRVWRRQHRITDVIGGVVLGSVVAVLVIVL